MRIRKKLQAYIARQCLLDVLKDFILRFDNLFNPISYPQELSDDSLRSGPHFILEPNLLSRSFDLLLRLIALASDSV